MAQWNVIVIMINASLINRETDLDNVLQTPTIFLNVSKGQLASKEDIKKSFKTEDEHKVVEEVPTV
jgi:ribosome maturation protein SDO1